MKQSNSKDVLYLVIILCMFIFGLTLTSCGTQGYGCKGNQSWNTMVKRINRG